MNAAKKIFRITLGVIVTITLAAGVFYYLSTKYQNNVGGLSPTTTPTATPFFVSSVLLSAKVKESEILIIISPEGDITDILALNLKVTLKGERTIPIVKSISPNEKLIKEGWYFPVKSTSRDENGNVVIELSAVHTGKSAYQISKETTIASLVFSQEPNPGALALTLDNEVTKFLSSDGESRIEVITNNTKQ